MRHSPKTAKGLIRKWLVKVAEFIIGVFYIIGLLYLFCSSVSIIQKILGVK